MKRIVSMENKMDSKKTAIIVGLLFITATVSSIMGGSLIASVIVSPGDILNVSANENQMIIGALLVLIDAIAVAFIAILMFPILKKHNESLALGYVGLRGFEAVIFIVGAISTLSIVTLSRNYAAGALDASHFQALGTLLVVVYDWTWVLGPLIFFALSTLPFYYLLYKSKLIPRWLSGWGFIGGILIIAQGLLSVFGSGNSGFSDTSIISMFLFLPIAVQEMVLAAWLIIKGFNQN
jgi:hypothetical protein